MQLRELILHLGSNVGERQAYIHTALIHLEKVFGKVNKKSSFYNTEAWGHTAQAPFLNMSAIFETHLSARKILKIIKDIENATGRIKREHWKEREIDIDILFLGDEIFQDKKLQIPHPEIKNRNFVMVTLDEIAPDFMHPVYKVNMHDLYLASTDKLLVEKWKAN